MTEKEVMDYIKKGYKKGGSEESIAGELKKAGHKDEDVKQYLQKYQKASKRKLATSIAFGAVLALLVIIAVAFIFSGKRHAPADGIPISLGEGSSGGDASVTDKSGQDDAGSTLGVEDPSYVNKILTQAVTEDDVGKCDELQEKAHKDTCVNNYYRVKAVTTKDIRYCEHMTLERARFSCEQKIRG